MWYFEGRPTHRRERFFPFGALELIVHLDDDVYREVNAAGVEPYSRACVSGQMLAPIVIEAPAAHTAVIGIRLRAAGAFALLGRPVHDLTGITADLEDVAGTAARQMADRCAAEQGAPARLRAAGAWLEARLPRGTEPDAAVVWAAKRLRESGGAVPIAKLQERTGWSVSRFTRVFREQIGIPPKALARVLRFNRALGLVRGSAAPLGEVALTCGYYDQAHFNAEFRDFCGFAPSEYRARLHYPGSASLAET
jgi:AraC-like DNA-binding protein